MTQQMTVRKTVFHTARQRTLAVLAAVIAAIALPQLFHMLGAVTGMGTALGQIFLPMHLPVLLVGLLAGPAAGRRRRSQSSSELCHIRNACAYRASFYGPGTCGIWPYSGSARESEPAGHCQAVHRTACRARRQGGRSWYRGVCAWQYLCPCFICLDGSSPDCPDFFCSGVCFRF